MVDRSDLFLKYWEEQRDSMHHCEAQRASLSNLVLLLSGAGIAFTSRELDDKSSLVMTIGLILLGIYGMITTVKYYERYDRHASQARAFAALLAKELHVPTHHVLLKEARNTHRKDWRLINRIRLNFLWSTLHAIVTLTGAALTILVLVR